MKRINLSDIPKQDPLVGPEGYLEDLPQKIQARLQAAPLHAAPQQGWLGNYSWLLLPRLQLLFSLLVVAMAGIFVAKQDKVSKPAEAIVILDSASDQEIINYLNTSTQLSIHELSEGGLERDVYAIELAGEEVLENEIIHHIDSYSSEELWK